MEKRRTKSARNLVVPDKAERREGVGCQASGGEIGEAWAAPTEKRKQGQESLGAYPRPAIRGRTGAQRMDYWGHPQAFLQTLAPRGKVGSASPRKSPQADRGSEEAATSRVGEGKLCTLWSHQESLPSNCAGEKLLWILSWLVTQLPAPKRRSCPVIFPRARCDPLATAGYPESGLPTRRKPRRRHGSRSSDLPAKCSPRKAGIRRPPQSLPLLGS